MGQEESHDGTKFAIRFFMGDRMIRFILPMPTIDDAPEYDGRRRRLMKAQRMTKVNQMKRQRGRALMLVIKAKLESIESGIETLEQAFLANIVMADGATVFDRVQEPIALEYRTGKVAPAFLLEGPKG